MTTLEILAPYLAHGIDCQLDYQDGHGSELVKLAGLAQGGFGKKTDRSARVAFADGMARWVPADKLTPVLRSFADLCTPLEDGTVPAVEVAKLLLGEPEGIFKCGLESAEKTGGYARVWVTCKATKRSDDYFTLIIYEGWGITALYTDEDGAEADSGISTNPGWDYLRRLHFAVGLSADQYIRKEA